MPQPIGPELVYELTAVGRPNPVSGWHARGLCALQNRQGVDGDPLADHDGSVARWRVRPIHRRPIGRRAEVLA